MGARAWLAAFAASGQPTASRELEREHREAVALVNLIEGRREQALAELQRVAPPNPCEPCGLALLARAFDMAGQADSALSWWERYAATGVRFPFLDATELATAYRRLGELYEARGNRDKALDYYGRFADLWQDADPELQPVVREVKARIARLVAER